MDGPRGKLVRTSTRGVGCIEAQRIQQRPMVHISILVLQLFHLRQVNRVVGPPCSWSGSAVGAAVWGLAAAYGVEAATPVSPLYVFCFVGEIWLCREFRLPNCTGAGWQPSVDHDLQSASFRFSPLNTPQVFFFAADRNPQCATCTGTAPTDLCASCTLPALWTIDAGDCRPQTCAGESFIAWRA